MTIFTEAQAHEEAGQQGGIQANMHIDPADHPVVNKETKFFFTFSDPDNLFKLENCDCKISVTKGGQQIDQHDVSVPSGFIYSLSWEPLYAHTFSESGDYQLHFDGKAKPGTQFDNFDLNFGFHVAQANEPVATTVQEDHHHTLIHEHGAHAIIFGGGLIAAIILFFYGIYEKRQNKLKEAKDLAN